VLSADVDELNFIRRLSVADKFPVKRIQVWILTQQVNYYFYEDISLCFRTKTKNEKFLISNFRRTQQILLFSKEIRKCLFFSFWSTTDHSSDTWEKIGIQ
jgi:hypothetical protein